MHRGLAERDTIFDLARVQAVRHHGGVGREPDRQVGRECAPEAAHRDLIHHPAPRLLRFRHVRRLLYIGCERQRRDVERLAILFQHRHGLVVEVRSVIDRADARADRGFDAFGAVRVRRHGPSPTVGFRHCGLNLGVGILLGARGDALRQHGAGDKDLDEVRAVREVRAHRFDDFLRAVGEIPHERHVEIDRELTRVAGATRRRHVVTGDDQARTGHSASIDRLSQLDIDIRPGRSHVAAGRETGHQRQARIARTPQCRLGGRRRRERRLPVHVVAIREMRMEID